MSGHFLTFVAIFVPAVVAIIVALIHTIRKRPSKDYKITELDIVKDDVETLKTQLELQHIKIDDISERLSWLEGRDSKT